MVKETKITLRTRHINCFYCIALSLFILSIVLFALSSEQSNELGNQKNRKPVIISALIILLLSIIIAVWVTYYAIGYFRIRKRKQLNYLKDQDNENISVFKIRRKKTTTEFYHMSEQSSLHCQDDYLFHYEISIRNEYMRFACMFYLFTLFAFVTTIFLLLFAYNSYYNESESIQRRFIPYIILGTISLTLFLIFFIGSLVYTSKLIKKLRLKQTVNAPKPLPRSIDTLTQATKQKSIESLTMNEDESYDACEKISIQQKFKTTNTSYHPCQTDV
ncbi:unnamed protein product [Rotaria sp. Silwood2]|nr:unnamed protein product [Rotaria sp. Silwood2]CAF3920907.1 unnamed protein product [Rotaria sp. Silwood2]CAF3966129.1 unnamed protein product [Rotaria sp. Silwood2]CAF4086957.1 unnamed protein product [Rotaria sp. Silwood2]